mmetsp:Transcript_64123/g.165028  ORF Transcript_64123/g.165028 Transcript_64123/m.165028 type:complete len:347 (-) Transcript_64123:492-1532(-)
MTCVLAPNGRHLLLSRTVRLTAFLVLPQRESAHNTQAGELRHDIEGRQGELSLEEVLDDDPDSLLALRVAMELLDHLGGDVGHKLVELVRLLARHQAHLLSDSEGLLRGLPRHRVRPEVSARHEDAEQAQGWGEVHLCHVKVLAGRLQRPLVVCEGIEVGCAGQGAVFRGDLPDDFRKPSSSDVRNWILRISVGLRQADRHRDIDALDVGEGHQHNLHMLMEQLLDRKAIGRLCPRAGVACALAREVQGRRLLLAPEHALDARDLLLQPTQLRILPSRGSLALGGLLGHLEEVAEDLRELVDQLGHLLVPQAAMLHGLLLPVNELLEVNLLVVVLVRLHELDRDVP